MGVGVTFEVAAKVAVFALLGDTHPFHRLVTHRIVRLALLCEGADLDRVLAVCLTQGEEFPAHAEPRVRWIVVGPTHEVVYGVEVVHRVIQRQHQRAPLPCHGEPPHREGAFRTFVRDGVAHRHPAVFVHLDVEGVVQPLRHAAGEGAAVPAHVRLHGEVVRRVGLKVLRRLPHAVSAVKIPRRALAVMLVKELAAFLHVALKILVHEIELVRAEPDDAGTDVQRHHELHAAALEHGAFSVVFEIFRLHFSPLRGFCALALPVGELFPHTPELLREVTLLPLRVMNGNSPPRLVEGGVIPPRPDYCGRSRSCHCA